MPPAIELQKGDRFGRWRLLSEAEKRSGERVWLCQCDCGTKRKVLQFALRSGDSKSCGCLQRETASSLLFSRTVPLAMKHGEHSSFEYAAWANMKDRCLNTSNHAYRDYGGRGIGVCRRWIVSFPNFLKDMGRKPSAMHSLDRYPNNNGDYEPGNCRWATRKQQSNNTRSNHRVEINGISKNIQEWSESLGIPRTTFARNFIRP
jgi:hypothetical protein